MSETIKILWSGLTGRIEIEAVKAAQKMLNVEIVLGLVRHGERVESKEIKNIKWLSYDALNSFGMVEIVKRMGIDVIVDFSHPDVFDNVLGLAIRTSKPLISGTSNLSNRQVASLYDATNHIPIFRGGNFRFKVKKFIDECVEVAKREEGTFYLCANSSPDVPLWECSETSNVIHRRMVRVSDNYAGSGPQDYFPEGDNTVDWEFHIQKNPFKSVVGASCHVVGYDEFAHDVLEITKVMAKKPVKKGELYDLDKLWSELVS